MIERVPITIPYGISGIYMIKCLVNNKFYIGSSVDIKNRWKGHIEGLKRGNHNNRHLQNAWNKYGESNFVFSVVEVCEVEDLITREQHYIDEWKACKKGFNIAAIAGKPSMTPETRKRQSESLKKNVKFIEKSRDFMKNLHNDPESQKKLIESVRNSEKVKETLKRINESPEHKEQVKNLLEQIHSDPRIQKIVKGLAQQNIRDESWKKAHNQKDIVMLTPEGEIVRVFISLGEITKMMGFDTGKIKKICISKSTEIWKGYRWMYKDDYENNT